MWTPDGARVVSSLPLRKASANPLGLTCTACGAELVPDPGRGLVGCLDGGGGMLVCPRGCQPEAEPEEANPWPR